MPQYPKFFSRRSFLESTALVAGVAALPRMLEYHVAAAQSGEAAATTGTLHPLDPLSAAEMADAVKVLRAGGKLTDSFRFVSCELLEPERQAVRDFKPGAAFPRQAFVVLLDNATGIGYEAVVDLPAQKVTRFDALAKGIQPAVMMDEFGECEAAVKRSPEFRAALLKRGITDVELVMVEPESSGHYGTEPPEDQGRRLLRALCFVRTDKNDNGFAHPLDGMLVMFDLNRMEVVRVEDYGVMPVPAKPGNWAREYIRQMREDLKPLEIVQPDGPSFTVDGHEVRWQKWAFRIGFNPREGLVLHDLRYQDEGRERSILRRASMAEMVVPYGDPGEQYYRKNAFDMGEYGLGTMANSLVLGCDCLGTIRYFDADLIDSRGRVVTLKNAICLHEEDAGLLWKHTDWRTNQCEVRRARRLSVSFIATVGNYEYAFYWHFNQDGTLHCEVKLTGVLGTTALAAGPSPYGVEIAPGLNAPYHQHIFAARLDPAIDGEKNSVHEVNMVTPPRGPSNPHGNAFRAVATPLTTEQGAQRSTNASSGRFWRIVNPQRKNALGQPVGYRLVPGENSPSLLHLDAAVMRRAAFAAHSLWVTPYARDERYPAGEYPNQHSGGDGLPRWTASNRPVENTELVVWYVFAHTHVPRCEDWPVMPAASLGFHLKPDGFFTQNPALDVPPSA